MKRANLFSFFLGTSMISLLAIIVVVLAGYVSPTPSPDPDCGAGSVNAIETVPGAGPACFRSKDFNGVINADEGAVWVVYGNYAYYHRQVAVRLRLTGCGSDCVKLGQQVVMIGVNAESGNYYSNRKDYGCDPYSGQDLFCGYVWVTDEDATSFFSVELKMNNKHYIVNFHPVANDRETLPE